MLNVFYTVDVEIWCDGWNDLDVRFADSFRRYIHGSTASGEFGIPYQLELLEAHGLRGVFFVEPLFAGRFGIDPLAEIVGMLSAKHQDVELHMHTEWVDEVPHPVVEPTGHKRQHLRGFSLADQTALIAEGLRLMREAGASDINAFRAGNFGFNTDSLVALANNGLQIDSSYNACHLGPSSGLAPGTLLVDPVQQDGVYEYPVTVFVDGMRRLRPLQLTACSWSEMEGLLWRALEAGYQSVVIVSHSFELLDADRNRPDRIAIQRFRSMCEFLDKHRGSFRACGFDEIQGCAVVRQPELINSPIWHTARRLAEQGYRRIVA